MLWDVVVVKMCNHHAFYVVKIVCIVMILHVVFRRGFLVGPKSQVLGLCSCFVGRLLSVGVVRLLRSVGAGVWRPAAVRL